MGLREQAAADFAAAIEADNEPVTFTPPAGDGAPFVVQAQIIRRASRINPATGEVIADNVTAVSVPVSLLPLDESYEPRRPAAGWSFECTDVSGRSLAFVISAEPLEDSTLGFLTVHGVAVETESD